jgi:hypothetical protein
MDNIKLFYDASIPFPTEIVYHDKGVTLVLRGTTIL